MAYRLGFVAVLLLTGLARSQGQGVTANFDGRSLREALTALERDHGYSFAYLDSLVEGVKVDCRFVRAGWAEVADCLFAAHELSATDPAGGTVLITAAPRIRYSVELASVVVTDALARGVSASPDGRLLVVRPAQTAALPGFAEPEVYRLVATLPGVTLSDEAAGNLSVRGGARDQTLVLFDGIPVYAMGHYFGMISLFEPSLIEEMVLHRGHADASHGGRLSGVLKLNTAEQAAERTSFTLAPNLLYGSAAANVPIVKEGDLRLAYRGSFSELLGGPTYASYRRQVFQREEEDTRLRNFRGNVEPDESFTFDELNGRLRLPLAGGRLTASAYYQYDGYGYREEGRRSRSLFTDELTTRSYGLGLNWASAERTRLRLTHTDFTEQGELLFREGRTRSDDAQSSHVTETSLLAEYAVWRHEHAQLKLGAQAQHLQNDFQLRRENPLQDRIRTDSGRQTAYVLAPYVALWLRPAGGAWSINVGLRVPYYEPTERLYLEPRLGVGYTLAEGIVLKAAYARNHQFVTEITAIDANQLSSRTTLWALSQGSRVPVAAGQEVSAGLTVSRRRWLFEAEAYHKWADGLSSLNFLPELGARGLRSLSSRGWGIDLLGTRRWPGGWSARGRYTLGRIDWRLPRGPEVSFAADNDRRHYLQLLASRKWGRWEYSAGWLAHSGARYSELRQLGAGTPVQRPSVADINGLRLPFYHRLDLSVRYQLFAPGGAKGGWEGWFGLSLLNAYGQENVLDRSYLVRQAGNRPSDGRLLLSEIDRLGLGMTPNVSVTVKGYVPQRQ